MTKKIRLIDEPAEDQEATGKSKEETLNPAEVMKYLEAIDWKLWEILKVAKRVAGE